MDRTTLVQFIRRQEKMTPGATGEFTNLMNEVLVAAKIVSLQVNNAGLGEDILGMSGRVNVQGEEVQKLDDYANSIFIKLVGESGNICAITSEENEKPVIIPPDRAGKYIFMVDPLDGSSNIDVNVNIGTIFAVYRKQSPGLEVTDDDLLQPGTQQVAAGYIIYGPSTLFVYTSGNGVHSFTLDPALGEFFLSTQNMKIPRHGSTYSVNEGNSQNWQEPQKNLVHYLKEWDEATERPYKLRYIGSLVADFHRTLLKGGIFMYPGDKKSPQGKLRYAFEAAPLAMIVENAGGKATDGKQRILDIRPTDIHQRVPLYIGSSDDLDRAHTLLG
ncbi:class 1 fructose-bisphosphatase [Nitrospina watsonii]|uniref:Fructose-1,6-bisphosphatase class 1 n=1 Tax=Nitrospina watsonii TaxID=1323948 RepID=A0ABN8VWU2_9BACT|nr:class 1 fructose-bisphosphatase [Nitrospina watsonii]CAI2718249.1 fructose-1,6-bisphosphatase [Nitrospina watsonii]